MQPMINARRNEELLMLAPWAVSMYSSLFHSNQKPAGGRRKMVPSTWQNDLTEVAKSPRRKDAGQDSNDPPGGEGNQAVESGWH
jgi:hypothetical protein